MRRPVPLSTALTEPISAIVYGTTGAGKTVFACGSQRMRTLHLDVERGAQSAAWWPGDQGVGIPATRHELIHTLRCDTFKEVLEGYQVARANREGYDLVVVDTVSELQRMVLQELRKQIGQEVLTQREWGLALTMMLELIDNFKRLGCHVLFLAHEMTSEDQYERRLVYRPAFQGQLADQYARHFSLIARYVMLRDEAKDAAGQRVRQLVRALQCRWDGTAHCKDRYHVLEHFEKPFIDHVFGKIMSRAPSTATQAVAKEQ